MEILHVLKRKNEISINIEQFLDREYTIGDYLQYLPSCFVVFSLRKRIFLVIKNNSIDQSLLISLYGNDYAILSFNITQTDPVINQFD